ncbi:MAG: hypothetical protein HY340_03015 [Candidatus Kerfeldbacteria bacterium]|nr:hypothetical protein [Candidatus Kerfeldbacteria bacterium]
MELTERQQTILKAILDEHIKTALPVGSSVLVDKYGIDLSPASIRNEMAELDDRGYLAQPHTSAGRIPTVKAYRYYLDHFVTENEVSKKTQEMLSRAFRSALDPEDRLKMLAKTVAELCSNTVIIGFAPRNVYYTGIANLFHQPEFAERVTVLNLSAVVDHLDEVIADIFDDVAEEPQVLLGRDNPFGHETGVLLTKLHQRSHEHLFGILGPVRMPYDHHLAVLRYTTQLTNV